MLGHVLLALNLRSNKEPLIKLGFLSNKVMILWAIAAICTRIIATNVPSTAAGLKVKGLTSNDWAVVIIAAVIATSWMEIRKILKKGT
jgi:Ca2+-transporting ATPase